MAAQIMQVVRVVGGDCQPGSYREMVSVEAVRKTVQQLREDLQAEAEQPLDQVQVNAAWLLDLVEKAML